MSRNLVNVRAVSESLASTPFHPQWIMGHWRRSKRRNIIERAKGQLLDIGCGRQQLRAQLPASVRYTGVDYLETSIHWYRKTPSVYADAHALPFDSEIFDTVLLLDVLEHLEDPQIGLMEAVRVLLQDGTLIISVPFLYPIHDAPRDFTRWTEYGISALCERASLQIRELIPYGRPIETAGLNLNLAFALTIRGLIRRTSLAWLLIPFAAFSIFAINIFCWLLGKVPIIDAAAPASYLVVVAKQ